MYQFDSFGSFDIKVNMEAYKAGRRMGVIVSNHRELPLTVEIAFWKPYGLPIKTSYCLHDQDNAKV